MCQLPTPPKLQAPICPLTLPQTIWNENMSFVGHDLVFVDCVCPSSHSRGYSCPIMLLTCYQLRDVLLPSNSQWAKIPSSGKMSLICYVLLWIKYGWMRFTNHHSRKYPAIMLIHIRIHVLDRQAFSCTNSLRCEVEISGCKPPGSGAWGTCCLTHLAQRGPRMMRTTLVWNTMTIGHWTIIFLLGYCAQWRVVCCTDNCVTGCQVY